MSRKSLTAGLKFEEEKSAAQAKAKAGATASTGKIALILGCFLVGGAGIAYSMGLFDGAPKHAGKPVNPQGEQFTPEVQKSVEQRQKRMELPEGSTQKPVVGAS